MREEEWFKIARPHSAAVRAQQEARRQFQEVLDCDDCQTPVGYIPCERHPMEWWRED